MSAELFQQCFKYKLVFNVVLVLSCCVFCQIPETQQQINDNSLTNVENVYDEEFGQNCIVKVWNQVDKDCGIGNQGKRRRHLNIYQGGNGDAVRWPYSVAVQELHGRLDTYPGCYWHYCGGSLIAPNLVLTAAHCLWNKDEDLRHPDKQKGKLLKDLYVAIAPRCRHMKGTQRIPVARYFIPDDFWPGVPGISKEGGDIAILMLESSVSGEVPQIQIASGQSAGVDKIQDSVLTALGWGSIWYGDDELAIRHLRQTNLFYIDANKCNSFLRKSSYSRQSMDSEFEFCCHNESSDTCDGDSGGPIILADQDGNPEKDVLIGISSWGLGQCGVFETQQPGVYTNVSQYEQWIRDIKTLGQLRQAFLQDDSESFLKSSIQNISSNTNALEQLKETILLSEELGTIEGLRRVLVGTDNKNLTTIKSVQEQLVESIDTAKAAAAVSPGLEQQIVPQFNLPPAKPLKLSLTESPASGDVCPEIECEGNVNLCCMLTQTKTDQICIADITPWVFGGSCTFTTDKTDRTYWIGIEYECMCKN
eukprot:TRINITY_DN26009_c0_g1_i12.p1 TRINITY_DN26009_c0_g1~~TRINITY_DN26009_c0_g1_i12.p1  ORF type:complete len:534 (-),score=57.30 TRINITY_DN26009_c0_g1_i12:2516-4117(-)